MADATPSHPDDRERAAADEVALAGHATVLADAIDDAIGAWVRRCVVTRCQEAGRAVTPELDAAADDAAQRCRDDVVPRVRALLGLDPDEQRSTPLVLLRGAVRFPTEVLAGAGVPPVERDEFARRSFPDDPYDLTPASFAAIDESLREPGLVWGAAKAHVHLARRRAEGRT